MGFQDNEQGEGYTKFSKGENLHATAVKAEDNGLQKYQDKEYYQLHLVFRARPATGGETGLVPAWPSSKITIADSDEHTSHLAKLLLAVDGLEDVLRDLGADDEIVQAVLDKDDPKTYQATTQEEQDALLQAVAKAIIGKVVKAGTKWNKDEDYSVINDFYEGVPDSDLEAEPADTEETSSDDSEAEQNDAAESDDDDGENLL